MADKVIAIKIVNLGDAITLFLNNLRKSLVAVNEVAGLVGVRDFGNPNAFDIVLVMGDFTEGISNALEMFF